MFVLSHESLTSRLHESLGAAVMSLSGGRPTDMSTVVPWQLSEQAAQSAVDWLAVMKESGGSVFCGGRRTSTYVEPAVVTAPAGTRALPSPPPEAPFFVIDSYDKHPRAQLERFPELTAALVFSPDARRGVQLARLADVSRVEVFSPRPATAGSSPGGADPSGVDLSDLIADMTRRKRVDMVYTA